MTVFFTRCSSTPWCKQQARVISPSVFCLRKAAAKASFAPSPFSARASAIRSRTCGRQRLVFLASSSTGGARKPNPSEGAEAATAADHRIHQGVNQTLSSLSHACGVTTPLCKGSREKRRRGSKFRAYKKRTPEKGVRFFLNSSHHDANIPNLYLIRRSFAPQSSARSHKNTTVETP